MKTTRFLFAASLMLAMALIFSCSSDGDSNRSNNSSGLATDTVSCLVNGVCTSLDLDACIELGGQAIQNCPVSSSSATLQASSSSSSQIAESSSSSAVREYDYCVFISDRICLTGPMSSCPSGGALSNSCPYGSSSSVSSSSSSIVSSSSSIQSNVVFGPSVSYGGETYQTVVIGSQTWFQRNLNYNVSGSRCYGEDGLVFNNKTGSYDIELSYSEIQAYCATFGRLYNWATAMALSADCNEISCSDQIQQKHRGICPIGWHIPSDEDLDKLIHYVDSTSNPDIIDDNEAGRKLKATSGWKSSGESGNGEDTYGFLALPGGYCLSDGHFSNVGLRGHWWSVSVSEIFNDGAYSWQMVLDERVLMLYSDKSALFSVRCLKD